MNIKPKSVYRLTYPYTAINSDLYFELAHSHTSQLPLDDPACQSSSYEMSLCEFVNPAVTILGGKQFSSYTGSTSL